MADRTCVLCGKVFKFPSGLKSHQARKSTCAPVVDDQDLSEQEKQKPHPCKFCGRRFTTQQGAWRHIRNACKIAGSEAGMEKLYEHTLKRQLEARTRDLENKLDHVMNMLSQHTSAIQPADAPKVILHDQRQVVNITHNVTINFFGNERTPHIDRPAVKALLDDVLASTSDPNQGALTAFLRAATMIYSDPTHPENITCYLPNSRKDDVLVHGVAGWEIRPYTVILPPMASRSVDALFVNQPFNDAKKYEEIMIALRDNEQAYKTGGKMKTVLVRNKKLLEQALGALPK